jgi:hypothetical protein
MLQLMNVRPIVMAVHVTVMVIAEVAKLHLEVAFIQPEVVVVVVPETT